MLYFVVLRASCGLSVDIQYVVTRVLCMIAVLDMSRFLQLFCSEIEIMMLLEGISVLIVLAVTQANLAGHNHLNDVLIGCSEICNTSIVGVPSKFFPFIAKKVDCAGLWSNKAIDASRPASHAPDVIPPCMKL